MNTYPGRALSWKQKTRENCGLQRPIKAMPVVVTLRRSFTYPPCHAVKLFPITRPSWITNVRKHTLLGKAIQVKASITMIL